MGLISGLLTAPLLPVRGVVKLGEVLRDQADQELYGRSTIRRELDELEEARAAGDISPEEETERQREILEHTMRRPDGMSE